MITYYRHALGHDAQYAAARAARNAGIEKLPQARAGLLPSLSLNANTISNRQESLLRVPGADPIQTRFNSNGWSLQLNQPLFRWQNWVAYSQAELATTLAELELEAAHQDLIVRLAQAYFEVLAAEEAVATTRAQISAIREQLEAARRNFELGTATITDTHEAQARHDLATAQALAAESDLLIRQQALRSLTGQDTAAIKKLRPGMKLAVPQPESPEAWSEAAANTSVQVMLRQTGLEMAEREISRQRAGHYPTVDLVATHGSSATGNSLNYGALRPGHDVDVTTVGVQITLPIFAGGGVNSKERESIALKEKSSAELEHARRTAALQARQAYLGVSSGLAQIRAYEAALFSSQSSVDSNKLAFQVGARINIDVLNAQSQLYETRQKLAKARIDTLLSQLKLKQATGRLDDADLQAVNALLE